MSTNQFDSNQTNSRVTIDRRQPVIIQGKSYFVAPEYLEGCKIGDRFKVIKKLGRGSFGHVFKVSDIKEPSRKLAVKICKESSSFEEEIKAMSKIHSKTAKTYPQVQCSFSTPDVVSHGKLVVLSASVIKSGQATYSELLEAKKFSFVVMPKYSLDIEQYFNATKDKFSKANSYFVGFAVLQLLEQVHRAGYVFNDLKPDNLITTMDQSVKLEKSDNIYA